MPSSPANSRSIDRLRTFVALCSASGMTLLCLILHHFDWDITSSWSFVLMSRHHCGRLLLLSCLWALMESALLVSDYLPTPRNREPLPA